MAKRQIPPKLCQSAAILSLAIALISFSGIVLKNDFAGRLIFGSTWSLVGIGWLGQYFHSKNTG
ncbi:MAG: hypothetical protein GTO17_11115 [Candidatus Aminicenantes bacterium]|nr:hypothetical protein [Candidatus Aminicenantes bacterium]